jgi:divalent metal cation (Fe/Co/Zn/Cd) transporter
MALGTFPSISCQTCGCLEYSCAPCETQTECSNCSSCCCTPAHSAWRKMRIGAGIRIEYLSSAWMILEALASIGFGLIAGSLALLAFGGDSLIELISGFVVLVHLRRDATGSEVHSKRTEQITSALLFALIPIIGLGAVYSYASGLRPEGSPLGIAVSLGAVVVMPFLYFRKKQIGEETRSIPLKIDAIESVTCLLMAIVLLGGLLAEFFLGLWWVDYLATGLILAFVAKEAVESYLELHEEE